MELQQKEGYNPMSGCLPLLIQMPIIIFLYNVIRNPLSHICRITDEGVLAIYNLLNPDKVVDTVKSIDQIKLVSQIKAAAITGTRISQERLVKLGVPARSVPKRVKSGSFERSYAERSMPSAALN